MFDNLTPGGWLEEQEVLTGFCIFKRWLGPDSALSKWADLLMQAAEMGGVDARAKNGCG